MKTLTKILTVVAVVALCVCLFTLTAFAVTVERVDAGKAATCEAPGYVASFQTVDKQWYADPGGTDEPTVKVNDDVDVSALTPITANVEIPQLQHDYSVYVDDTATCKAAGKVTYECSHGCGKTVTYDSPQKQTHTPGTKHEYDPPTCKNSGNMEYYDCSVCGRKCTSTGAEISDVSIPATGNHAWKEVDREEPTATKNGWILYECQNVGCSESYTETIPMTGLAKSVSNGDLYTVIAERDTWYRGEEPLTFRSNLIKELNTAGGDSVNYVGVRLGTNSLYQYSWDTYDFWSWDQYVKIGDKEMNSLRAGHYFLWIYDKRNPERHTNTAEFDVVDVATLEAYSTDKHVVNSSKSLRFVASEEIDPNSVWVGSKKLYDSNDFFVSNDRKNITLSAEFLNNRQTGTYTISALTKGGETIKTNFYILTTAQASSSPRTGDESQIGLWAAFLLLSGAAVVVLVPKLRKQGVK